MGVSVYAVSTNIIGIGEWGVTLEELSALLLQSGPLCGFLLLILLPVDTQL